MSKAAKEKELGNSCLNEGKFSLAISHYSKALSQGVEEPHKVFCNRSLAYLRLATDGEGEAVSVIAEKALKDANQCLVLNACFLKVRRCLRRIFLT